MDQLQRGLWFEEFFSPKKLILAFRHKVQTLLIALFLYFLAHCVNTYTFLEKVNIEKGFYVGSQH